MDEFQDEPQVEVSAPATDEPVTENEGADTATEEVTEEQKVTFDDRQQAKVNELISGKVAQTHEQRRRADEAERQLAAFQANQPVPQAPEVPEMPTQDELWDNPEKLVEWEKATRQRAKFDADNDAVLRQQEAAQQQQAQAILLKMQERNENYTKTAGDFNMDPVRVEAESNLVAQSIVNQDTRDFILEDKQGPLVVSYLANNPLELEKMRIMTPLQQAAFVTSEIKPKLASTRTVTQAPAPATIVDGAGAPKQEHPVFKGAVIK